ncbi:MAG: T9SS type A sorting domain-containing protein, partial [Flavobacteriales bacterium]
NGFTYQTSSVIVGFSQTNDPTGDWNFYALPGNPIDNETWADYPVVGISDKDLYIGINTFTNGSSNNSGFTESCLWQVGLKQGYLGWDLISNYYSDILPQNKPIFNITPIQHAAQSDAENMYLLSNRNTDAQNDSIFLLEVTGRATDTTAQLVVRTLQADQPYILPVPAKQQSNQWFDTNDSRILGGYFRNNQINFVQSCTDPSTGTSAIYHGIIDDVSGASNITSRIYSEPDLFYGYPNISWSGLNENDEQSIISFNHCSSTVFAGFSALHVNSSLEASNRIEIKSGLSLVNVLADTLERWGDYSGSQRLYDEPGTVWAAGSFGDVGNGHGTWLALIRSPDSPNGIASSNSIQVSTKVYPNPVMEQIQVEFELNESILMNLELVDSQGKLVQLFMRDRLKAGKNRLSFNGEFLSSGTYFLVGTSESEKLFSKKLIKQ